MKIKDLGLRVPSEFFKGGEWRQSFVDIFRARKNRGPKEIALLNGVHLELRAGESVGLVGPNGAGKTSFCRCLAGIYTPTSGSIETQGDVQALFEATLGLYPYLSGRENLQILFDLVYPEGYDPKLLDMAAHFSELGEKLDTPYRNYSLGMKARLTLSVVCAKPKPIMIFDEVFENLDISFRKKILTTLEERAKAREPGVRIFVTHSPEQVRELCQRVLVMKSGEIRFDGDVESGLSFYEEMMRKYRR